MPARFETNSWEFTQKMIRIGHNRRVKKYFKDIVSDADSNNGRAIIKNSLLIRDADSAIETMNKLLYFSNYLNTENVTSYPEGWMIKKGQDIPQLAIIYRDTNKQSISGNYTIYIPHYNGDKTPRIPSYRKGDHWARWILKDNSQLLVNGSTEAEVLRVIRLLERYVEKKFSTKEDEWLKVGRYAKNTIKEIKVAPTRADYYPKGKANNLPQWRHYF